MNVIAISVPLRPGWRWRIVNYAGEIVEESEGTFATISEAVAEGAERRRHMNATDRSTPPPFSINRAARRLRRPS